MRLQSMAQEAKITSAVVLDDGMSASTFSPVILLSSTNFDPQLFLRQVHQFTSYEELSQAADYLARSLALREDTLKTLVKQNFDRFVNAKNSIDGIMSTIAFISLITS